MKKRLQSVVAMMTLTGVVVSSCSYAFADSAYSSELMPTPSLTSVDENAMAAKKIDIMLSGDNTQLNRGEQFRLPKTGNQPIRIICEKSDEDIEMSLPEVFGKSKGIMSENGEASYASEPEKITVSTTQEVRDGIKFESLETRIEINDETALGQYAFDFDLPEGYRLEETDNDSGEAYILDNTGESTAVISVTEAFDSNGNPIKVRQDVNDSTLIETVDTTSITNYPVTVTLAVHPNKTENRYLTKTEVKNLINTLDAASSDLSLIGGAYSIMGVPGHVMNALFQIDALWCRIQKGKFQSYYNQMNTTTKRYLKITTVYRWRNGGKYSGYVPHSQSYSLVAKKA